MLNDCLTNLEPPHQGSVVVPLVLPRVVARIDRQYDQRHVDNDRDYTAQLLLLQDGVPQFIYVSVSELTRQVPPTLGTVLGDAGDAVLEALTLSEEVTDGSGLGVGRALGEEDQGD